MQITENNGQQITLVANAGLLGVFGFIACLVLGVLFTGIGLWHLFAHMSEIVAPSWAEAHGFSGQRWRSEGSDVPTSLAVSFAISLFWTAFSMFFVCIGGDGILFSIWKRLEFDFSKGQVILKRRGLRRCPDRTHPISGTFSRIEQVDEDGDKYQALSVTIVQDEDQQGWFSRLPWRTKLWFEKVKPDQVIALGRLL